MLDLPGQLVNLAVQRLNFVAARYAQTRNGAVQTLVKSTFQLIPFADREVFHVADTGLGRLGRVLDLIELFLRLDLGLLLGFLTVFYQCLEKLAAVVADLGISPKTREPDLARVLLDLTDPRAAIFIDFLFASHPALLIVQTLNVQVISTLSARAF
ncbi:hypothetical protein ALP29_200904 [Pseudomonas syringae pv. avii]|uniref:Uncharacterized protein n=1 Tax=Pseudomonas syringae pv. avii TaxID=663959 RepID=A0A3M5UE85_PSESX|nr:hypothetical protein ALP29_200904 [Pseudomonas syringae pv. avii]